MYQKIDKAKVICLAYKNGTTIKQIASAFNQDQNLIKGYLERYFEKFYGEPFRPYAELRALRLEEIYKKYKQVYVRGLFTRRQMCEICQCSVMELEAMIRKYRLHHQWLKTYDSQVSLCNTSNEFREAIKEFAENNGYKSVRDVAVCAINEFMLQETLRKKEKNYEV